MIARICTEKKQCRKIRELVASQFECFSVFPGIGAWKGQHEESICIEIALVHDEDKVPESAYMLLEGLFKVQVIGVAKQINKLNQQEAVLVEFIQSTNVLV